MFIGKNLSKKTITDGFLNCECDEGLRFAVGDRVRLVSRNQWKAGAVEQLWDKECPYRVGLDEGGEAWAPADEQDYVQRE